MGIEDVMNYMGYLWYQIEGNSLTLGVNEEGLDDFDSIVKVALPGENDSVDPDEVCGELDTDDGPINIYTPVEGRVIEVNGAVIENPNLIGEDPYGDGWLFRIEADVEKINQLSGQDSPED